MPDPGSGQAPVRVRSWLVICAVVVVIWGATLLCRTAAALPATAAVAWGALRDPAALRIERSSGISQDLVKAIRRALPPDGQLVLYSPYGGKEFELDGADPRGEPARQVRLWFERMKNLLYPAPRQVAFARDAEELRARIDDNMVGRLLVVDGTQGPGELTVGGRYELVYEVPGRVPQLRVWALRGVR